MNDLIIHRGPDDDGIYRFEERLAMGMRRLSIIDLATGKQPISNHTNDITIVFNGEIYNYQELRAEQEEKGIVFKTETDTEVILSLYETYGEKCLDKLNGMFAFSIHDRRTNTLFIARDRFGEKPLYYHQNNNCFIWASELKSIINVFPQLKIISPEALNIFFALTYIPAPYTIYKEIFKLLPGHCIKVKLDTLESNFFAYWELKIGDSNKDVVSYEDAKKEIRKIFFESVEKRMIADVPLGVFLSGGVDSTIIAAIMAKVSTEKIKTFSVGFTNKKYDESGRAKIVANHIDSDHHEYILNYEDFYDKINNLVINYDEPYADSSCIPTYFISKKAVENVKVVLTGDGGDEVFGGYNKYLSVGYRKKYQKHIPDFAKNLIRSPLVNQFLSGKSSKSIFTKVKKMVSALDSDIVNSHLNMISLGFQETELQVLINPEFFKDYKALLRDELKKNNASADELKQIRYIDQLISLEGDMLVKVDRASMLCSLECRAPFLDHRLMEYTNQLPDEYLIKGNNKKRILKDTFRDLLPDDFFNSPKSGFEIPVGEWFRGEMKTELDKSLSILNLEKHNLLNVSYVRNLYDEHISFKKDHSWKLWSIFCFQKWYLHNFKN